MVLLRVTIMLSSSLEVTPKNFEEEIKRILPKSRKGFDCCFCGESESLQIDFKENIFICNKENKCGKKGHNSQLAKHLGIKVRFGAYNKKPDPGKAKSLVRNDKLEKTTTDAEKLKTLVDCMDIVNSCGMTPIIPATRYFIKRGIELDHMLFSPSVKFIPNVNSYDFSIYTMQSFHLMTCKMSDNETGQTCALHLTGFDNHGNKIPLTEINKDGSFTNKISRGLVNGQSGKGSHSVIAYWGDTSIVHVCEGFENIVSVMQSIEALEGVFVFTANAGNLKKFKPSSFDAKKVFVWSDNDSKGLDGAIGIKSRFDNTIILTPPKELNDKGKNIDWNDMIKQGRESEIYDIYDAALCSSEVK